MRVHVSTASIPSSHHDTNADHSWRSCKPIWMPQSFESSCIHQGWKCAALQSYYNILPELNPSLSAKVGIANIWNCKKHVQCLNLRYLVSECLLAIRTTVPHIQPSISITLMTPPKIDKWRVLQTNMPGPSDGRVSIPSLDHFAKFGSQKAHVAFGSSCSGEDAATSGWAISGSAGSTCDMKKKVENHNSTDWKPRLVFMASANVMVESQGSTFRIIFMGCCRFLTSILDPQLKSLRVTPSTSQLG